MKDSTQDCAFCKRTFSLKDEVIELSHKSYDPFSTILDGLRAFIDKEIERHMFTHEMEVSRQKERIALNDKTIEVVGRALVGFLRDCATHPGYDHGVCRTRALDGAYRGCAECLEAVVRKARETPAFSAEDAAAVDEATK